MHGLAALRLSTVYIVHVVHMWKSDKFTAYPHETKGPVYFCTSRGSILLFAHVVCQTFQPRGSIRIEMKLRILGAFVNIAGGEKQAKNAGSKNGQLR
jgi:hypothetical protein